MKACILLYFFIAVNTVFGNDFIDQLPFSKENIDTIVKDKKEKAAGFLCDLYFPEEPDFLISLLGNEKFQVRAWARDLLSLDLRYKSSVEKHLESTTDPEVKFMAKEVLRNIGKFNNKVHRKIEPVLSYLIQYDGAYEGRQRLGAIYEKWIFIKGFHSDKYLKNFKPDVNRIISILEEKSIPEEQRQVILNYLKKEKGGLHKVTVARGLAKQVDLGIGGFIEKIDKLSSWGSSELRVYADEVMSRPDYKENRLIYVWKFLDHKDEKVQGIAYNMIRDEPGDFLHEVINRIKKADRSHSSAAGVLIRFKDFKKTFTPYIELMLNSKGTSYLDVALEIIEDSPEQYREKLEEIAKTKHSYDLEEMLIDLAFKHDDIDEVKKKFLNSEFEQQGNNHSLMRNAKVLNKMKFKADKEVDDFLKSLDPKDDYRKSMLVKCLRLVDGDKDYALKLYLSSKDKHYYQKDEKFFMFVGNQSQSFKNYMLNIHIYSHDDEYELYSTVPKSLQNSIERLLLEVTEKNCSWKMSTIDRGFRLLQKNKALRPFIHKLRGKANKAQKVIFYHYLVALGELVEDEPFYKSLVKSEWIQGYYSALISLQIISNRPVEEVFPLMDTYVSKRDKFYWNEISFLKLLSHKQSSYLAKLEDKLKQASSPKEDYFWAMAVFSIDPTNALAEQVLNKLSRDYSHKYAKEAFKILATLGKEPLLDEGILEKQLKRFEYDASYLKSSKKNLLNAQKIVFPIAEKVLFENYYVIDDYFLENSELSSKLVDLVVKTLNKGDKKKDGHCAHLLSSAPKYLSSETIHELLEKTKDKKAVWALVWTAALMGDKASSSWELINRKLTEETFKSPAHLYFAGAVLAPQKEERKEYFLKLMKYIEDEHIPRKMRYHIRKVKLVTEFNDLASPFFKKVIESDKYLYFEKEEAFWGMVKNGITKKSVEYFEKNINESTFKALLSIAVKHPNEMKTLIPSLIKSAILFKSGYTKIQEVKLSQIVSKVKSSQGE